MAAPRTRRVHTAPTWQDAVARANDVKMVRMNELHAAQCRFDAENSDATRKALASALAAYSDAETDAISLRIKIANSLATTDPKKAARQYRNAARRAMRVMDSLDTAIGDGRC